MKELLQKLHDAAMQAILETEDVDSLESLRVKRHGYAQGTVLCVNNIS